VCVAATPSLSSVVCGVALLEDEDPRLKMTPLPSTRAKKSKNGNVRPIGLARVIYHQ
jgi:hypothetical protein